MIIRRITIGIPREVKENECRVSLTPYEILKLIGTSKYVFVTVFVEKNAGIHASYTNEDYINAGAIICDNAKELYSKARIIVKVKEPQESEYEYINENHLIFTFFHFASNPFLLQEMLKKKTTCIAYETIKKDDGTYPILSVMSKIAGEQALAKGLVEYHNNHKNKDKNKENTRITVIGVGNVGKSAVYKALSMGYKDICLIDMDTSKLNEFDKYKECKIFKMNESNLNELIRTSMVVVGSIYISGKKALKLITNEMLDNMMDGSVIIDIAIDQGGITEQSLSTKITNPFIRYKNTSIYCVPNIPSLVPYEASKQLSMVVFPYLKMIVENEMMENWDEDLKRGININKGELQISL